MEVSGSWQGPSGSKCNPEKTQGPAEMSKCEVSQNPEMLKDLQPEWSGSKWKFLEVGRVPLETSETRRKLKVRPRPRNVKKTRLRKS